MAETVKVPRGVPVLIVVAHPEEGCEATSTWRFTEALMMIVVRGLPVGVEPSARGRVEVKVWSPLIINSTVGATSISVVVE